MILIKLCISLALCLILLEAVAAFPGDFLSLTHSKESCYMAGDYAGTSVFFGYALKCQEACAANHYNAACCATKSGETDTAFERLSQLIADEYVFYLTPQGEIKRSQPSIRTPI